MEGITFNTSVSKNILNSKKPEIDAQKLLWEQFISQALKQSMKPSPWAPTEMNNYAQTQWQELYSEQLSSELTQFILQQPQK